MNVSTKGEKRMQLDRTGLAERVFRRFGRNQAPFQPVAGSFRGGIDVVKIGRAVVYANKQLILKEHSSRGAIVDVGGHSGATYRTPTFWNRGYTMRRNTQQAGY